MAAQDLDDCKAAAKEEGVEVIPFPRIYQEAKAVAKEVQRAKSAQNHSYDNLKKSKEKLLKSKKQLAEKIEEEQEFVDDMKAKSDSYASSIEEDLNDLKDEMEEIEKDITAVNKQIEDAIEKARRLWNARGGLREYFEDALKEVGRAKSYPKKYIGSGASKEELDEYEDCMKKIESKIKKGERTHREQEVGTQNTERNLKELLKQDAI